MDGLDHQGDTPEEVQDAIMQITRQDNRREKDTTVYTPDPGKTAFVVRVYDDGEHGLQFTIGVWTRKSGSSTVTVDWGDGTTTTSDQTGEVRVTHTYVSAGDYMVQISDDITYWCPHFKEPNGTNFNSVDGRLPQNSWSFVVTDGHTDGYWTTKNILKVHRFLQWGNSITGAHGTFNGCINLTGSAPKWNNVTTNAYCTYKWCVSLTGPLPEWGSAITSA